MKNATRRQFLINSSKLVGGTMGAMVLGSILLPARDSLASKIDFPETSCGVEKKTTKRILVAYASLCGTTGGVAEAIGQVLCEAGAEVDVRLIKNVENISAYNAVVVGSAVRSASWWPDALAFIKTNRQQLTRLPVAYFLTCLALFKETQASRNLAESYMMPALEAVPGIKPVGIGIFSGVLDYSKLNLVYRMVMKSKMRKNGVPEGDYRRWSKIRSWAGSIQPALFDRA